jgi:hypothetical protein
VYRNEHRSSLFVQFFIELMNTCDIHLDRLLSYCNFPSGLVLTVSAAIFPLTVTAESDGWYTRTQAKAGETLYNTYCAQCHRPI